MSISEFQKKHKAKGRRIIDIIKKWNAEKAASDFLGTSVYGTILLGDLVTGRDLLDIDKIPEDIVEAMKQIFKYEIKDINSARVFLAEKIAAGNASVIGTTNAIQGRIGEFHFEQQFKGFAKLSENPIQQHYDVKVSLPDGPVNYVQVKVYKDPGNAFDEFEKLNNSLINGEILDQGVPVTKFSFAVNEELVEGLKAKASLLNSDIEILSIGATYDQIRSPIVDGINDHSSYLDNFFEGLLGGMVVGTALHAGVNGYLCYKGHKALEAAFEDTAYSSAITGGGIAAGMGAESLLFGAALGPFGILLMFGAGVSARSVLKRIADRRHIVKAIGSGNSDLIYLSDRLKKAV